MIRCVQDLRFTGSRFRVWGLGFRVQGLGCRGFRVKLGLRFRETGLGFRFRVWGSGFRVCSM